MNDDTSGTDGSSHVPGPNATSDDGDLQASIANLAGLVTASFTLDALLGEVASFAVHAIPGAEGAGVTLLSFTGAESKIEGLAASAPFVAEIDQIQYETVREGPCITAAREQRTVRSGSLGGEKMWPRFGPRVGRLGVHSALSLPLLLPDQVVGAINVYARVKDAFDDRAVALGEAFAKPAAVAVHNAQVLSRARTAAAQLDRALKTRPVIDQAIGIVRGRRGCTEVEAFARLRAISQDEHRRVGEVAQRIVDDAVRRARARHIEPKE